MAWALLLLGKSFPQNGLGQRLQTSARKSLERAEKDQGGKASCQSAELKTST
jgi:hypothetical protein